MMINKIIGYALLVIGMAIIVWAIWQSYVIFTGKASAPLVFQTSAEIGSSSGGNMQDQINEAVQGQLNKVIPPSAITKILNLATWSMLAFILIIAGSAVSRIGVKLIK